MKAETLIVCAVLAVLGSAGCERSGGEATLARESISADELGRAINFPLPSDARVLRWEKHQGMDEAINAKLEMPATAWASFFASLGVEDEDLSTERLSPLGSDEAWWGDHPRSIPGIAAVQIQLPNAESLNVGVDRRDPDRVIVYLFWFQT